MDREQHGGWVYIMANRYHGTIYVGVTSHLAARVLQHRNGEGSDFCIRYGLNRLVWAERGPDMRACIAQEKRIKRWQRAWKFELIEAANPDWRDLYEELAMR
ncbi:GIY-YIG nuclease family protein [Sandaracinobacter neustonicus]|uniref:GIY-YIG nuclease family protein n=1 Tax=Sandaracinobacter neustonicus TaxID=1715348 RepID=A0A501XLI0_9SPHN|nr:GIY-YIG nuclease family protein [Sandaracinobacter neustonicus]TPE61153.1 GIY-YIG nuclease family protein [Sandaracinobacter neustonicus]